MSSERENLWSQPGGFKQLIIVAFPLILSMGSISVLLFVDRMFLSWYSADAIAAAVPAGILNFAFICFFLGLATYTSTFVAQYTGANRPDKVGPSLWNGIYIALIGGALIPLISPFTEEIFAFIGHPPEVQKLQAPYLRILNFAGVFFLCNATMSCFYSGRGKSWTIVWVNITLTLLNALLDYAFIFGHWGFPEMGIQGAGLATILSSATITLLYASLIFSKKYNKRYHTRSGWRFKKDLFTRFIRFGAPSGVHFFLDVSGFTVFILLTGRIGYYELTASNIILQVNLIGFLPLVGLGVATTILVGQFQGAGNSKLARRATWNAVKLAAIYSTCVATLYITIPELLVAPFLINTDIEDIELLRSLIFMLFYFLVFFTLFDSLAIICASALKGAGDTRFVMATLGVSSLFVLVIPVYLVVEVFHLPFAYAWGCALGNYLCISLSFALRFRSSRWESIEVIERVETIPSEGQPVASETLY
jgi:MATE family multidrug resistance protein|tara:strand:+ start:3046 stop:4479 length:1434 start_codon:yes stop_codon:yes gene_type:complete